MAASLAALVNPFSPTAEAQTRELRAGAQALGVQLHVLHASSGGELDSVFATVVQLKSGGLVIAADAVFNTRVEQIAALALQYAVPTAFLFREFAAAGGLISYGGSIGEAYRLAGSYIGRILKGERPADLPVQQATRIELIINMKTAKALGLTFPITLLGRADEVIE